MDLSELNVLPNSLRDNKFLSKSIKKYIRENVHNFKSNKFLDNRNSIEIFDLEVTSDLEEAKKIYKDVRDLARRANTTPQKPIRCYIFFVDEPKELNYNKNNITSEDCNSGSTTFYDDYIEVLLWRKEEWEKVFYHELVHAFYLDKILMPEDNIKDLELLRLFPHYNNSIFEAYTEILGTLLYFNYKKISKSQYKDQNIFLGTQVNKIIEYMNSNKSINQSLLFFKNPIRKLDGSTNTSSYYILKSIYLWNSIYKDKTLQSIDKLIDKKFLEDHFYDLFINTIKSEEYFKWLDRIYIKPRNNSLRLTMKIN